MAEWRQKLRGTTLELDQVTGLIGLLAYDTENQELRVYDGVLLGGYRIPNLSTIDTLYKLPERLTVDGKTLEGAGLSANGANENGWYFTDAATTDQPEAAAGVIQTILGNDGADIIQYWTRTSNGNQYKRTKVGAGAWSAWERVADLEYINTDTNVNAYAAARLGGQLPAYYTDIVARLGYTPANKAGDTFTGIVTFAANQINIEGSSPRVYLKDTTAGADDFWVYVDSDKFFILTDRADDGNYETPYPLELRNATADGLLYANLIWTAGNDGAGSGLDADLLDGQEGSYYSNIVARLGYTPVNKAGDTMTGNLTISNSAPQMKLADTTTSAYDARVRLDANNFYVDGSSDGVNYTEVLRFEMDTKLSYFQNTVIINSTGEGLRIDTPVATNDPYISFYQLGTRKGYVQYTDGAGNNNGMRMINDVATGGDLILTLKNDGGVSGLEYTVNGTEYVVLHSGLIDTYDLAKYYTGTDPDLTSYPLGSVVLLGLPDGSAITRNATYAVYYVTAGGHSYGITAGTQLSGTWRARGDYDSPGSGSWAGLAQRVA